MNLVHENDRIGSSPADKREKYWPEFSSAPASYGSWPLSLSVAAEDVSSDVFGLRRFAIDVYHKATGETRRVVLIWYSAWEDFQDPREIYRKGFRKNAKHVLKVAHDVDRAQKEVVAHARAMSASDPWLIVHCSAGVGRTGTLMTLIMLLRAMPGIRTINERYFLKQRSGSAPNRLGWLAEGEFATVQRCAAPFKLGHSLCIFWGTASSSSSSS